MSPRKFFYDTSNSIKAMDIVNLKLKTKAEKKQKISRKKDSRKLDLLLNQKKVVNGFIIR